MQLAVLGNFKILTRSGHVPKASYYSYPYRFFVLNIVIKAGEDVILFSPCLSLFTGSS